MDNIFSKLAQGPQGNIGQEDYNNWNQMVGSAPPDQFGHAVSTAIGQIDPNEYAGHITPGVNGTDPLGALGQPERSGIIQSVLGHLTGQGINHGTISQATGLQNLNPQNMSQQDMSQLLQYVQQNHPQALGQTAAQYQNQPNVIQSLLGNKGLMLMAGTVGAKLLADQLNRNKR